MKRKNAHLLFGIFVFIVFAFDVEYDRDFLTWMYLLISILNILLYLILTIQNNNKKLWE